MFQFSMRKAKASEVSVNLLVSASAAWRQTEAVVCVPQYFSFLVSLFLGQTKSVRLFW